MNEKTRIVRVHLTGLEDSMRRELSDVLRNVSCQETDELRSAQIVFCGWDPENFPERIAKYGRKPVVVVSRAPDVNGWLDALEAGAADYCAAPFEPIQMRWILDAHLRRPLRSAAA